MNITVVCDRLHYGLVACGTSPVWLCSNYNVKGMGRGSVCVRELGRLSSTSSLHLY